MKWNDPTRPFSRREEQKKQQREFIRTMKACRGDRPAQRQAVLRRLRQRGGDAA